MGVIKKVVKAVTSPIASLFAPDIPDPPKVEPPPDPNIEREKAEAEAAKKAEEEKRKRAKYGRSSTFGTNQFGVKEDPNVSKRTLLGG